MYISSVFSQTEEYLTNSVLKHLSRSFSPLQLSPISIHTTLLQETTRVAKSRWTATSLSHHIVGIRYVVYKPNEDYQRPIAQAVLMIRGEKSSVYGLATTICCLGASIEGRTEHGRDRAELWQFMKSIRPTKFHQTSGAVHQALKAYALLSGLLFLLFPLLVSLLFSWLLNEEFQGVQFPIRILRLALLSNILRGSLQ